MSRTDDVLNDLGFFYEYEVMLCCVIHAVG